MKLKTELNGFLLARKELLEDAADETKKGTTAFDLLKGAVETFNTNAGTLIGGNQPFAGPTGFTADIAQFLVRQQKTSGVTLQPGTPRGDDVVSRAIARNTQALEENTAALTGKRGNGSTATSGVTDPRVSPTPSWRGTEARQQREARIGP